MRPVCCSHGPQQQGDHPTAEQQQDVHGPGGDASECFVSATSSSSTSSTSSSTASIIAGAVAEMTSLVELHAQAAMEGAVRAENGAKEARRAAECALMEVELLAARATAGLDV